DDPQPDRIPASAGGPENVSAPVGPMYVPEGSDGVAMIRPAAMLAHKTMDPVFRIVADQLGAEFSALAKQLKIDTSQPGFVNLRFQDIESVSSCLILGTFPADRKRHSFHFGDPTITTVAPFDWLGFLRQWRMEFEEVRAGERAYYKIIWEKSAILGPDGC